MVVSKSIVTQAKNVHFVGIKGVAMTSLALCLQDMGISVSGSDVKEDFVTKQQLVSRNISILTGFSPSHIQKNVDLVIYTGAHSGIHNPEVEYALQQGIPVLSQAQALGELMASKHAISVCGTGGKSTTTALVSHILNQAGLDPSFSIGVGKTMNLGVTGKFTDKSKWFVAEADEYTADPTSEFRPRFSYQNPEYIICTNLSYDHPDVYPTFTAMQETFYKFFERASKAVYLNGDNEVLYALALRLKKARKRCFTIGMQENNDIRILKNGPKEKGKSCFFVKSIDGRTREYVLHIPGLHNVYNASIALSVAADMGIHEEVIYAALSSFSGVGRRFEYVGRYKSLHLYDDYAHTPIEIKATLSAAREWFGEKPKLIAIFQPHTYSRTKALFEGFATCFDDADTIILLDIFASAREKETNQDISSEMVVEGIRKHQKGKEVLYAGSIARARELISQLSKGDCATVFTLGAGDVYTLHDVFVLQTDVQEKLQHQFPAIRFVANAPLSPHTFMKVGGKARLLAEVSNTHTLEQLVKYCFSHCVPFLLLGGGSNVVLSDEGIDQLVILNKTKEISIIKDDEHTAIVQADSGVVTAQLAGFCSQRGLAGLEYFVGVPGTVGGAVFNNSHFRPDVLIADRIIRVRFIDEDGVHEHIPQELDFSYDHSYFQNHSGVIVNVEFTLLKEKKETIQKNLQEVALHRSSTQPLGIPSSGCMYKNPFVTNEQVKKLTQLLPDIVMKEVSGRIQVPAGYLIDRAGLKGSKVGDAVVSDKHATYILNRGKASSEDIVTLCERIETKVKHLYGISLEREVFFL